MDSAVIYGRSYGLVYYCEPCQAWVGCHPESTRPLGRLANSELRLAKREAHAAFDPIWKTGKKKRNQAYGWLALKLGIPRYRCHIGMFDVALCARAVEVCRTLNTSPPA